MRATTGEDTGATGARAALVALVGLAGCAGRGPDATDDPDPDADAAATVDDGDATDGDTVTPTDALTERFVARLSGLWTGPATTILGPFPLMNVDLRAADAHALWGRVDLDPDNALRFALEVEDRGDGPVWVYRNGGYFLGLLRDDRTVLTSADPDAGVYRFCDVDRGCAYIDATYTFPPEDADAEMVLDVQVLEAPHVHWTAHRAEPRAVPDGFPAADPLPADAPLPSLPTFEVTVSWSTPLDAEGDVWVLLATEPCADLGCTPSRSSRAVVQAGGTEALVVMPEIHPGPYYATAVLDRDRDLAGTLLPELTDGLSLPDREVTVPTAGVGTAELRIVLGG